MKKAILLIAIGLAVILLGQPASAQSTTFNYQGNLKSSGVDASGSFDFEFALFDAVSGGAQVGSTLTRSSVPVTNGIFGVSLDFGAQFPGAGRFLEIRVRETGVGSFTTLSPRQPVTSTPYSVKTLNADNATNATNAVNATTATTATNATQLGGQPASFYTNATNLTAGTLDPARLPVPLSLTGNAAIGTGIINGTNASTAGNGVYGLATSATGFTAGGYFQGNSSNGYGVAAEASAPSGTTYGVYARSVSTDGRAVYGLAAGLTGANFGVYGVSQSTSGYGVYGLAFPSTGTTYGVYGQTNSAAGYGGYFVGRGYFSGNLGVGVTSPQENLSVANGMNIDQNNLNNGDVTNSLKFGNGSGEAIASKRTAGGIQFGLDFYTNFARRMTISQAGFISVLNLGAAGATTLCRNANNEISTCSSSLRYKTNIVKYSSGLSFVNQLRPITFEWKDGGMHDLGLAAEDVAKVDPLLVTYNKDGQVEGVKYDRIGVVLINAVKEQQAQIEKQEDLNRKLRQTVEKQQAEIDALKSLVCRRNRQAAVCKAH